MYAVSERPTPVHIEVLDVVREWHLMRENRLAIVLQICYSPGFYV